MNSPAANRTWSPVPEPARLRHVRVVRGCGTDVKPVTAEVVESVLSRHMDDLEPRLVRHGYDARSVAELIGAKPGEVRLLLQGGFCQGSRHQA